MAQRVVTLNRHNSRQDGAGDADGATVVDELLEGGRLEEQLCDNEVSACVDFLPGLKKGYICFKDLYLNLSFSHLLYRVVFLTVPTQFQYQNEKGQAANQGLS